MANEPRAPRSGPGLVWPIAILFFTAMLAGGFAGYNKAAAEGGDPVLAPWAGPAIAILFGAAAFALYIRQHRDAWRQWSPRKRLYWISLYLSAGLGIVIAIMMQAGQIDGSSDLFSDTSLTPGMAIVMTAIWVIGLAVASVFFHRSIDDHERYAYQMGAVAGYYVFAVIAPAWWVLARAGLTPPVEVMPLFCLSIIVNAGIYLWFKFR
jgi:hypothetical protein